MVRWRRERMQIKGRAGRAAMERTARASAGDQTGDIAAFEPGINVDNRDVCGTTIQHAQQRRNTTETCPVADAGRHGDDRTRYVAADNTGQSAFHSRDDDQR